MGKILSLFGEAYVACVVMTAMFLATIFIFILTLPRADRGLVAFRDLCAFLGKPDKELRGIVNKSGR